MIQRPLTSRAFEKSYSPDQELARERLEIRASSKLFLALSDKTGMGSPEGSRSSTSSCNSLPSTVGATSASSQQRSIAIAVSATTTPDDEPKDFMKPSPV